MSNSSPTPATDRGVLLDAWVATRAEIARLDAQAASLLATRAGLFHVEEVAAPQDRDMARRSMIAEYAVAGRLGNATLVTAFADAELLTDSFPALHAALASGVVSVSHVHQILAEATPVRDGIRDSVLPDETLAMYEAACLVIAEQDSPTRTRIHARRIAAALTGETLTERHERAASDRNVRIRRLEDGMAELTVVLPEVYAVAILDRLTQIATHTAATTRTKHQQDAGLVFADPTGDAAIELDPETSCTVADLDPWDPVRETLERIESGTTWALDPDHEDHDPATDTCAAANLTPRQIVDARPEFVAADGRTRQHVKPRIC
ncbi:MAG: DUF222 domain-containing protein [Actinobacteria bacterium]|nr:DUF222 domain-containing protein [Actinomycetota bacterium]